MVDPTPAASAGDAVKRIAPAAAADRPRSARIRALSIPTRCGFRPAHSVETAPALLARSAARSISIKSRLLRMADRPGRRSRHEGVSPGQALIAGAFSPFGGKNAPVASGERGPGQKILRRSGRALEAWVGTRKTCRDWELVAVGGAAWVTWR